MNEALSSGAVYITRKDGARFVIKPDEPGNHSPLNVRALNASQPIILTDILSAVRESREDDRQ